VHRMVKRTAGWEDELLFHDDLTSQRRSQEDTSHELAWLESSSVEAYPKKATARHHNTKFQYPS
jgi:hypothetical protein